jgi:hypothetical protein
VPEPGDKFRFKDKDAAYMASQMSLPVETIRKQVLTFVQRLGRGEGDKELWILTSSPGLKNYAPDYKYHWLASRFVPLNKGNTISAPDRMKYGLGI